MTQAFDGVCELGIGWASAGCLPPSKAPQANRVHGGPDALLLWLEAQLGLAAPPPSATGRVAQYAALLAAAAGRTYAASLATDRWATAEELLRRRDRLFLDGWDGAARDGLPPLVSDLARVEALERDLPPSTAERLHAVLAALDAGQQLPPHRVVLAEEASAWPRRWRDVLARLDVSVAAEPSPRASSETTLGLVQRALADREFVSTLADESVRHVVAESRLGACEFVANALAGEPDALPDTVVVCESEDAAALLDTCLQRQGLPTMGASRAMAALPVLQVLPLVLQLCWEPVEPQALLDLVALPVGPIPPRVGRKLAQALSEQPGLGSGTWDAAVASLTDDEADPDGKTRERLATWFDHERVPRTEGALPIGLVTERCGLVAQWAVARASAVEDDDAKAAALDALYALAARASALGSLAASHGGPLTEPQLARLLDAVSAHGVLATPRPESAGGPLLVASLADVTRPVARLVWLGLGTADVVPVPWTLAERNVLGAAGIDADDGTRELSALRDAERRGLLHVEERLLAVGLPADEELRWHPLWQVVRESVRTHDDRVAAPAALRRVVAGTDAVALRPWSVRTAETPVEPPPPERTAWDVPAALLHDRETSSASSLETRLACPLKWTFVHLARLRRSATAQLPADRQLRGTFCHAVLAGVFGRPGPCPDVETARAQVATLFDERLPLDAAPLAQPDALVTRANVRRELLDATRLLVETLHQGDYQLAGAEVEAEGEVDGRALRGYIDCLAARPDGSEAVLDFKYGGRSRHAQLLADGRALQLATYAAARSQQAEGADVRVAYLLIEDGTVHTPAGSALHGAGDRELVPGAPSVHSTWKDFVAALRAADGWLRGETPIPARPLQDPTEWPPGVALVLDPRDEDPATCRYCDYGALCGRQVLE